MHWELYKSVDVNGLMWPVCSIYHHHHHHWPLLIHVSALACHSVPLPITILPPQSALSHNMTRFILTSVGSPGNLHACCLTALLKRSCQPFTVLFISKCWGWFCVCIHSNSVHTTWSRNTSGCCLQKKRKLYFRFDCFSGVWTCISSTCVWVQSCHHPVLLMTGSRLMRSPRLC